MSTTRATIEDVARVAGVSVATVSRALRNRPNVAPSTRERVIDVAAQLGYSAHRAASSLASGRTRTIGLAAPFYGIWFTAKVTVGVLSVLAEAGYDLEVYAVDTPEHQNEFIERVASQTLGVDGLLLVDFFGNDDYLTRLAASGVDTVCLGQDVAQLPSVAIDNLNAARRATDHLIGLGHTKIGLIGAEAIAIDGSPVLVDRRDGFEAAMRDAGIEPHKQYQPESSAATRRYQPGGALTVPAGVAAMDAIAALGDPPTAVFCLSDETAMGAMGRARELGIDIPGDMSVVGFDDHDLAEPFGLTTMRQPVQHLGEAIANWLLEMIEADDSPTPVTDHVSVPVELVVRSSTAGPPTDQR
jgi:DNA-binding LacI/PurR family transcriptional regulator